MAAGIERALADDQAGELAEPERIERATRTVAQIAGDMMRAGQGNQVLALYAANAPKDDGDGGKGGPRSALLDALDKLGGASSVPQTSQADTADNETPAESTGYGAQPPSSQSGGRLAGPQLARQGVLIDHAGEPVDDARTPPPTPPAAPTPLGMDHDAENFEKNSSAPTEADFEEGAA